jgi:TRAP-type uncharacterized transport system substrate-binding protein
VRAIFDLFEPPEADAAIVPADVLTFINRQEIDTDIAKKVGLLAKLGAEDVHVIAASGIKSIAELRGKRVSIGAASTARYVTGTLVFALLGIDIVPSEEDFAAAVAAIQAGKLDAAVLVARRPSSAIAALPGNAFTILAIPLTPELQKVYSPDIFSADDYPALIKGGGTVDTLATGIVLAAADPKKDTDREQRLRGLTASLYANAAELRTGRRYADWTATNLAADVPGWTRSAIAKAWLDNQGTVASVKRGSDEAALKVEFEAFLASRRNGQTADAGNSLFEEFVKWKSERKP